MDVTRSASTLALSFAAASLLAVSLVSQPLLAQQATPAPAARTEQTAGEKYKNVQVLKDMPVSQFDDAMVYMNAATGQTCLGCHVRQPDGTWLYEKDDKDHKTIARTMLTMTEAINRQHFKGEQEVTCTTCHQGRTAPANATPLSLVMTADQRAMAAARGQGGPRPPAAPSETVDQVFEKYVTAIGGRDALQQVKSRVMKGSVTTRAGQTVPFTLEETAAGAYRMTSVASPTLTITEAFDGTAAWMRSGADVRDYERSEAAAAARFQELGFALRLKDTLSRAVIGRPEKIDGRDVIVVNGQGQPNVAESLYFDRESGLLLRRLARVSTVLGRIAVRVDFGDYRAVGAVKVPHTITYTKWDAVNTATFTEALLNAPVDAARFQK